MGFSVPSGLSTVLRDRWTECGLLRSSWTVVTSGISVAVDISSDEVDNLYVPLVAWILCRSGGSAFLGDADQRRNSVSWLSTALSNDCLLPDLRSESGTTHTYPTFFGFTGGAGGGKSTTAQIVARLLNALMGEEAVVVLSQDGFHLPNEELERCGTKTSKGRSFTFDLSSFEEHLDRTIAAYSPHSSRQSTQWPEYDRTLHNPRLDGPIVHADRHVLVLVEGLWVLGSAASPETLTQKLREHFSGVVFCEAVPLPSRFHPCQISLQSHDNDDDSASLPCNCLVCAANNAAIPGPTSLRVCEPRDSESKAAWTRDSESKASEIGALSTVVYPFRSAEQQRVCVRKVCGGRTVASAVRHWESVDAVSWRELEQAVRPLCDCVVWTGCMGRVREWRTTRRSAVLSDIRRLLCDSDSKQRGSTRDEHCKGQHSERSDVDADVARVSKSGFEIPMYVLGLNAALQRVLEVGGVVTPGAVHRLRAAHVGVGGKGQQCARACAQWAAIFGCSDRAERLVTCSQILGGEIGRCIADLQRGDIMAARYTTHTAWVDRFEAAYATRECFTVLHHNLRRTPVDADHDADRGDSAYSEGGDGAVVSTEMVGPSTAVPAAAVAEAETILRVPADLRTVVAAVCGTSPPGTDGVAGRWVRALPGGRTDSWTLVVDSSNPAVVEDVLGSNGVAARSLLKVNVSELRVLVGSADSTTSADCAVPEHGQLLRAAWTKWPQLRAVVLTDGVDPTWVATADRIRIGGPGRIWTVAVRARRPVRNAIGAGDTVTGTLLALQARGLGDGDGGCDDERLVAMVAVGMLAASSSCVRSVADNTFDVARDILPAVLRPDCLENALALVEVHEVSWPTDDHSERSDAP